MKKTAAEQALYDTVELLTLKMTADMANTAMKNGMDESDCVKTSVQAFYGSAYNAQKSGIHPQILIDMVCSPGGTTIEGVTALQENAFEYHISAALESMIKRERE